MQRNRARASLGGKCLSPGEGTHFGKDAEDPGHPSYPCGDGRKVEGIFVELRGTTLQTVSLTEDMGPCDSILLFWSAFKPVLPGARPQTLSSVAQSCPALCNPMDCSTPSFPDHHQLPELAQTHVHQVDVAIQPSVIPFSSCLPSFPASGSFPMSEFFTLGGQSIGVSASASVFPVNIQD